MGSLLNVKERIITPVVTTIKRTDEIISSRLNLECPHIQDILKAIAVASVFFIHMVFTACGNKQLSDHEKATAMADSFATALYNYNYGVALSLCDSSSRPELYFLISNLTEKDMEVIRNAPEDASVKITDTEISNDSTAIVKMTIHHFFIKDSIGKTGRNVEKASCILPMKKENGRWFAAFKKLQYKVLKD